MVQGAGSGVIITHEGCILTNNHVVEGAKEVDVTLADKREFKAKVVGRDPKTDLAVVKINAGRDLPTATLGDSSQLKVGDWVLAIGNPFGLSHTVTAGIVSAKGRVIGAGPYDDFIQTDASINPGNSGGPLFNMKGEVVGINTAIIPSGQGIGFAIPVNTAKPLIPQLVSKGEVTRGYLGVNIQSITPDLAAAMKLEGRKGALVADVVTGSPADAAGIKRGDVIVAYDGKAVEDSHDLPAAVAATPIDKEVTVTVVRDGKEHQLLAKIAKLESEEATAESSKQPARGKWGLQLQDLNPQIASQLGLKADHGVVVVNVQPGSPAEQASIQQGDVILEVNRHPVKSVKEVKEQVARAGDSDTLLLLVQSEQGNRYVALKG
jgi:serine protease Do